MTLTARAGETPERLTGSRAGAASARAGTRNHGRRR
jgi:hypothetical protein